MKCQLLCSLILFLIFSLSINGFSLMRNNLRTSSRATAPAADHGTLQQGEKLESDNGKYFAILQGDGNFVVYSSKNFNRRGKDFPIWSSRTNKKGVAPRRLVMQTDGNLVLYDKNNSPQWNSRTNGRGKGPFKAIMQDDGNLVIYQANGKHTWATGTKGKM